MQIFILIVAGIVGFLLVSALMNRGQGTPPRAAPRQAPNDPPPAPEPTEADRVVAACKLLGVSPPLDEKSLKEAYRALIAQYHPDRVSGLGPELQTLATQKSAEINEAYALLTRYLQQG